ncbi:unnamed protein product [Symbiodinium natans]|uniref:KHDC4/BBP-like KH-domain type I domain-containing protein n=1 Tax=Symbiodinium natans TaxID=878477 RepID=A0A812U794_9DINO|nr:unnamed protein product [Symbiodinium natans]
MAFQDAFYLDKNGLGLSEDLPFPLDSSLYREINVGDVLEERTPELNPLNAVFLRPRLVEVTQRVVPNCPISPNSLTPQHPGACSVPWAPWTTWTKPNNEPRRAVKANKANFHRNRKLAPRRHRMGRGAFDFTVVFSGYDHDKHADFELVPRVIGKGGCNMLPFPRMGASARVCGQGSGLCEIEEHPGHGDNQVDKNETLQLVVCCSTQDVMDEAMQWAQNFLGELRTHFRRFCRKKGFPCPELYYMYGRSERG